MEVNKDLFCISLWWINQQEATNINMNKEQI